MNRFAFFARLRVVAFVLLGLIPSATCLAGTEPAGSMATARDWPASVALADGRALIAGGYAQSVGIAASAEIYDPATATFSVTAPMSTTRASAAAVRLPDGRVLVVGGTSMGPSGTFGLASAEIFDPIAGTWSPTGSMSIGRRAPVALALPGGAVMVMGGDTGIVDCEVYDPATGTFTLTGAFPSARDQFAASLLQDGRVLVAGGRAANTFLASAQLWDPATGTWSPTTGSLSLGRFGASATTLANGMVLVAGGSPDGNSPSTRVDLYDPAAGTFAITGSLAVARYSHRASLLPDGNVVIAGGSTVSGSSPLSSLERYDVAAGAWASAGSMTVARRQPAAVILADGDVLLAGGSNSSSQWLASAEIVDAACIASLPSISPASASLPGSGGSGTVSVTHVAGCSWRVTNNFTTWITTSGAPGIGNGTVAYSVAANPDPSSRSTTITIAEKAFAFTQAAGDPCASAALSPTTQSVAYPANSSLVTLTAASNCAWTVTGVPSWITIMSSGTGGQNIWYSYPTNAGAARTATLSIANRTLVVTQDANPCNAGATISPTSASIGANGGTTTVSITQSFQCTWSSSGQPSWITMSQYSGTGSATPTLTVAVNTGSAQRSSTFTIAGRSYTLTQAGNPCASAAIAPSSQSFGNAGGTGTFSVAVSASCSWAVTGMPSWVTITSGGSGTGNGTVAYSVAASTGTMPPRTAFLGVAGVTYTVNQAAASCYPQLTFSPSSGDFTATGTSRNTGNPYNTVTVTTPPGCPWSLSQVPSWVTIVTSMPASGGGTLTYTVPPNTGAARSGAFFIVGACCAYTVNQLGAPGAAVVPTGRMSSIRDSHGMASLADGRVLVAGGFTGAATIAGAEVWDPATGAFSPTASLNEARDRHAMVRLADGRVLALGGYSGSGTTVLASAELWDPATGAWTPTGSMSTPRESPMALTLPDGRVMVLGGTATGISFLETTEIYDPATGIFSLSGSVATPRAQAGAAVLPDGRVLLAGGYAISGPYLSSAEIWDPATGTWSVTGSMASTRAYLTATTLGNGKVLIAGGLLATGTYDDANLVAPAELYDPATGTFSTTGSLVVKRNYHAAVALADGSAVLIAGNTVNGYDTPMIERYNPATGAWQLVGQLSDERFGPTAALLPNGKVLVAGGFGNLARLASAELFDPTVCTASAAISPPSATFASGAATGSVSVTMTAGCPRIVSGAPSWITITSGATGTGTGTVSYSVAANTGAARSATFQIAGASFSVSQGAAPPPSFCASKGNTASYEWIQQVTVAGQVRSTGSNAGYANFTAGTAIALARGSNTITLTPGFSSGAYGEYWRVWIDFNHDSQFTADELVYSGSSSGALSSSFVVPATALAGGARMRISMKYGAFPTACEVFTYGEVEDYTVTIP